MIRFDRASRIGDLYYDPAVRDLGDRAACNRNLGVGSRDLEKNLRLVADRRQRAARAFDRYDFAADIANHAGTKGSGYREQSRQQNDRGVEFRSHCRTTHICGGDSPTGNFSSSRAECNVCGEPVKNFNAAPRSEPL